MKASITALVSLGCVFALALAMATPATADTMYYEVEVEWISGDLEGETSWGWGTYNDSGVAGSGAEYLTPDNAKVTFAITIDRNGFDEEDDFFYEDGPVVVLQDGKLVGFDYYAEGSGEVYEAVNLSVDFGAFYEWGGKYAEGTVTISPSDAIPEPTTLVLFGLGAAGLLGWRRKRRLP